jgi:hypothetical protein
MTAAMPENHALQNNTFLMPPQAQRMSGQVCIVTGAASGIGLYWRVMVPSWWLPT